jgi:hypothetical protein
MKKFLANCHTRAGGYLKTIKIPAFAGMTILVIALTSCASIIEGSTQTISVTTQPNYPAMCFVQKDGSNTEILFEAPGTVEVRKSLYPLNITCASKNGGTVGKAKVLSDVANWGYGGAVAGVGVGAVVDSATGAANEYPQNIVIKLGQSIKLGETSMNKNADYNQ